MPRQLSLRCSLVLKLNTLVPLSILDQTGVNQWGFPTENICWCHKLSLSNRSTFLPRGFDELTDDIIFVVVFLLLWRYRASRALNEFGVGALVIIDVWWEFSGTLFNCGVLRIHYVHQSNLHFVNVFSSTIWRRLDPVIFTCLLNLMVLTFFVEILLVWCQEICQQFLLGMACVGKWCFQGDVFVGVLAYLSLDIKHGSGELLSSRRWSSLDHDKGNVLLF